MDGIRKIIAPSNQQNWCRHTKRGSERGKKNPNGQPTLWKISSGSKRKPIQKTPLPLGNDRFYGTFRRCHFRRISSVQQKILHPKQCCFGSSWRFQKRPSQKMDCTVFWNNS